MIGPLRDPLGRAVTLHSFLVAGAVALAATLGWPYALGCAALGALLLGAWIVQRVAPLKQRIQELAGEEGAETGDSLESLAQRVVHARQRLAEERRRAEGERDDVLGILEATSEGILVLGHQHRVEMINEAAHRLLAPPTHPLGRSLPEVVRVRGLLDYAEALRRGEVLAPRTIELPVPSSPGQVHTVSVSGALVRGDHLRNRAVLVLHDMTELSRLESVRTDFVANVTHEMRSPLASILGYAETLELEEGLTEEEKSQFLARILRNSRRLDDIIRDLIELSRLEHATAPEVGSTSLRELLGEIAHDFADQAKDKEIQIELELGQMPPLVEIDVGLVRQALTNLVDNAVKYTPAGGSIILGGELADDSTLQISVADSGPGIPIEHQGRIFERFYRVDTARSRSLGGTGLGLAIVKHAMALHGGAVDLESTESGATFRILVPLQSGG